MSYGLPYKGSKSLIAKWLIEQLPTANVFVDLFCGGGAVTHAAMLSGKYKRFIINDRISEMPNAFINAIRGEYSKPEYRRWVSREEFMRDKDNDMFVRLCWSFGNNGKDYLYSKQLESHTKKQHITLLFMMIFLCLSNYMEK